jgi:hypothetical protein
MAFSKDPGGKREKPEKEREEEIEIVDVEGGTHGSHWSALFENEEDTMRWIQGSVANEHPVYKSRTVILENEETGISLYRKEMVPGIHSLTFVADVDGSPTVVTGFPTIETGIRNKCKVNKIMIWQVRAEAQIGAILGDAQLNFFAIDYLPRLAEYRSGEIQEIGIGLIAYALRRNPPAEKRMVEIDGKEVDMSKTQAVLPLSAFEEWAYPDDYYVQGPVETLEEMEFLEQKLLKMRIGLKPVGGLDLVVKKSNIEGEPAEGDMITAYGWLVGKAADTDWSELVE